MMKIRYPGVLILALAIGLGLTAAFKLSGQEMTDEQKSATAQEFYNAGLDALKEKKYDTARDFFIKTIAYREKFIPAYAKLGDAYLGLKEPELGYEYYDKFITLADQLPDSSEDRLKLYQEIQGKVKKFRVVKEKALGLNNDLMGKLLESGRASQAAGDYFTAIEIFTGLLELEGKNSPAAEELSRAKKEQAKNEPVERLHADQELVKVYYEAGLDLMKQNKHAEAVEKLDNALTYRKASPEVFFSLGECHDKLNDPARALLNYGFCCKYLRDRKNRSKEDDAMLAKAGKCLEKLNPNITAFTKAKKDYVVKALTMTRDLLANKYQSLAYTCLAVVRKADPLNKEADTLLAKIDREVIRRQTRKTMMAELGLRPKNAPLNIFNGKDLDDWSYYSIEKGGAPGETAFSLANGKILVNPKNATASHLIFFRKGQPELSLVSLEFYLEKKAGDEEDASLDIIRYVSDRKDGAYQMDVMTWTFNNPKTDYGAKHTIDCIISKNTFVASLDAGKVRDESGEKPTLNFGLLSRNYKMEILSIAMQELEENTK